MNFVKKILTLLAIILPILSSVAQTEGNVPNRLVIKNYAGENQGYMLDYFDDIFFARVEGEVLAEVKMKEIRTGYISISIVRTIDCKTYRLMIVPTTIASQLDDDSKVISFVTSYDTVLAPLLDVDYAELVLPSYLSPETEYTIFTVGLDEYGTAAGVVRVPFVTPTPEITGNPHVDAKVTATEPDSFTVAFSPNDDVRNYWILAGEKGSIQEQYQANASQLGLANFTSMITTFGLSCQGDYEYTWNDLFPNTEYEVFVAMNDINGWFAPYELFRVSTSSLGGSGDAYVDINVESYTLADWNGVEYPTLSVSYSPNDQACGYRMAIYTQSDYDLNQDIFNQNLCSDPEIPTSNWYHFTPDTCDYIIAQSVPVVIIAAAKNAEGVWGNINTVRFTTPESIDTTDAQPNATAIIGRKSKSSVPAALTKGVVPKTLNIMPGTVIGK